MDGPSSLGLRPVHNLRNFRSALTLVFAKYRLAQYLSRQLEGGGWAGHLQRAYLPDRQAAIANTATCKILDEMMLTCVGFLVSSMGRHFLFYFSYTLQNRLVMTWGHFRHFAAAFPQHHMAWREANMAGVAQKDKPHTHSKLQGYFCFNVRVPW